MKLRLLSSTSAFLYVGLAFCSCLLHANQNHQFSINLNHSRIDYKYGDASLQSITGSYYLKPVEKSADLPYSRTAFYSRTGSLSLGFTQQRWKDMKTVIGPRVLKSGDFDYFSAGAFLAKNDLPVWASLQFIRINEAEYKFTDDSVAKTPSENIQHFNLGWYIQDTLSIQAIYVNQELDLYGGSIRKLFNLDKFGFLEISAQLTQTKKEDSVDLSTDTVRFLDVSPNRERLSTASIAYFPLVQTELWFSYQRVDHLNLDQETKYLSTGIEQYIFDNVRLGFRYTHKDTYARETYGKSNTYNMSLSFEF